MNGTTGNLVHTWNFRIGAMAPFYKVNHLPVSLVHFVDSHAERLLRAPVLLGCNAGYQTADPA